MYVLITNWPVRMEIDQSHQVILTFASDKGYNAVH